MYLSHYPLFVAGLVLLLRRRSPGRDRDGLLDALIVTTGIGLLAWVFVLGPYVRTAGLSLPARAVSLAYPLMDLLVVAVAARLAVGGGARPPAWWLLLASLLGLLAADGQYALAQLHGTYQTGAALDAGWLLSYVGLGAAAQAERARLLHRLGAIIDASPVAIVELDPAGRVQLWNPAAERIYGWRREEVLGRPHPASLEPGWPAIQPTATRDRGQPAAHLELRHHRSDGTPIDVELATAPLQTPSGEPAGMIGVAADITERKRLAEQLRHQALHDPLTDLANRALFHDRLEHALARLARHDGQLAVLLLDLDGFKTVNDTLGHAVGDQLLAMVAKRLPTAVRPSDTVARLGGDEFVVLVEDATSPSDAVAATQRLAAPNPRPVGPGQLRPAG